MGRSKESLDTEAARFKAHYEELDKLWKSKTKEEWDKILDEAVKKVPRHTKKCWQINVGGIGTALRPPVRPYKKWLCSEDCPIRKEKELKSGR